MELFVPVALILVGLALIAVEVTVVPGLNVVGVVGALGAATGVAIAFVEYGLLGGLGTLGATVLAAGGLAFLLRESGAWDRFVLTTSLLAGDAVEPEATESRSKLLGRTGHALTPLRPAGVVEVDDARIEVVTEGAFVAAGSRVRVVAIDRRRVLVRMEEASVASESAG
ncbi:MAG: NfeD family protein [Bacteroidota bacterium]